MGGHLVMSERLVIVASTLVLESISSSVSHLHYSSNHSSVTQNGILTPGVMGHVAWGMHGSLV